MPRAKRCWTAGRVFRWRVSRWCGWRGKSPQPGVSRRKKHIPAAVTLWQARKGSTRDIPLSRVRFSWEIPYSREKKARKRGQNGFLKILYLAVLTSIISPKNGDFERKTAINLAGYGSLDFRSLSRRYGGGEGSRTPVLRRHCGNIYMFVLSLRLIVAPRAGKQASLRLSRLKSRSMAAERP